MGLTTVNPFTYPTKARFSKQRILPNQNERSLVTVLLGRALNLKLEVYSLLQDRPKNEVALEALNAFLDQKLACDIAHSLTLPPECKKRITFILNKDTEGKLELAAHHRNCNKTCVVTAALIIFMQSKQIDPLTDPSESLMKALETSPTVAESW